MLLLVCRGLVPFGVHIYLTAKDSVDPVMSRYVVFGVHYAARWNYFIWNGRGGENKRGWYTGSPLVRFEFGELLFCGVDFS